MVNRKNFFPSCEQRMYRILCMTAKLPKYTQHLASHPRNKTRIQLYTSCWKQVSRGITVSFILHSLSARISSCNSDLLMPGCPKPFTKEKMLQINARGDIRIPWVAGEDCRGMTRWTEAGVHLLLSQRVFNLSCFFISGVTSASCIDLFPDSKPALVIFFMFSKLDISRFEIQITPTPRRAALWTVIPIL